MSGFPSWYRRLLSFPVVLAGALVATVFLLATAVSNGNEILTDPDIWWHLSNARQLVTTGHFIRQDLHTFTVAGKPWINFEWLAELPYYFAYRRLGEMGLFLVMMAVSSAIVVGVFWLCYLRSKDVKASFLAAWIAVLMTTISLSPRTLLFGWLLLIVELGVLWSYRDGRDRTWLLPPLFLVWINTHGSWFIGFVLMMMFVAAGFAAGRWGDIDSPGCSRLQARKLLTVIAVSFAALFINPYGWRLVEYPLDVAFHQSLTLKFVAEWATLDFHSARGKLVIGLLLGFGLLNLLRRRTWLLSDVLFTLIAVYGAVTYSRFVFLAGILVCPLLAMDLRGVLGKYDRTAEKPGVNAVALLALAGFIFWMVPSATVLHEGIAATYPEQALVRLRQLPPDVRMLNSFEWGGYLMWNVPQLPLFIDSRTDVFVHEGVMQDYARVVDGGAVDAVGDKYRIQYVLFPKDGTVGSLLVQNAGWKQVYADGNAVLFERIPRAAVR